MRAKRAVTLIETLIVICIVGMLASVLMPAVQYARESARRAQCLNNLHQIGVALLNYESRCKSFPSGYITRIDPADRDDLGPGWGWAALISRDIEMGTIAAGFNFNLPVDAPANQTALLTKVSVFVCPSDGLFIDEVEIPKYSVANDPAHLAGANYVGSVGTVRQTCKVCRDKFDGLFGRNSRTRFKDILDGSAKTFAVGERHHQLSSPVWGGVVAKSLVVDRLIAGKVAAGPAYVLGTTFLHGDQSELELQSQDTVAEIFGSAHPGIMNFLFCDGSVRPVDVSIDDEVYMALSTTHEQSPGSGIIHSSPLEP